MELFLTALLTAITTGAIVNSIAKDNLSRLKREYEERISKLKFSPNFPHIIDRRLEILAENQYKALVRLQHLEYLHSENKLPLEDSAEFINLRSEFLDKEQYALRYRGFTFDSIREGVEVDVVAIYQDEDDNLVLDHWDRYSEFHDFKSENMYTVFFFWFSRELLLGRDSNIFDRYQKLPAVVESPMEKLDVIAHNMIVDYIKSPQTSLPVCVSPYYQ